MENINLVIRAYFKKNKIKLKDISAHLNISQSNLSERLNSKRSITLDQFFTLYKIYGDSFAIAVTQHYKSKIVFLEKIMHLTQISDELKAMHIAIHNKNNEVCDILEEMDQEISAFS